MVLVSSSLPVRERGLKSVELLPQQRKSASLPVRERGLKYQPASPVTSEWVVAPCAGAWVEISYPPTAKVPVWGVAPCAGAWVEILFYLPGI